MKIIKTGVIETEKERANKGCNVCPHCGMKDIEDKSKDIASIFRKESRTYRRYSYNYQTVIDCYVCPKCGAEWESDPYSGGTYL